MKKDQKEHACNFCGETFSSYAEVTFHGMNAHVRTGEWKHYFNKKFVTWLILNLSGVFLLASLTSFVIAGSVELIVVSCCMMAESAP